MSKVPTTISGFSGGIAFSEKEGVKDSFKFGQGIDFRSDARKLTILPKTSKESGNVVTDLVKWAERVGTDTYSYGDSGNLYKRDSSNTWSLEHTAADSSGNGLAFFGEDDFLYYPQDSTIGRFGPINGTPTWSDDFLGSEGGAPTNTNSVDFESGSSQHAARADTASLSITGDLSLEAYIKPESLPTGSDTMALIAKWDESGTLRSYRMDLASVSNFFGDGSDGALTISTNTTEAPIDSAANGTAGTTTLTATNASFAAGQKILIHQTRSSTDGGYWETNEIASYTAGTITTVDPLDISYSISGDDRAQVRVMKQHTNVTVNTGITYTAKAWNDTVGGILAFFANGTVTVTGTISSENTGLIGGATSGGNNGGQGESYQDTGITVGQTANQVANESGGGAGAITTGEGGGNAWGGGGGGHATQGLNGSGDNPGLGGNTYGSADLTTMTLGAGGGGGGSPNSPGFSGSKGGEGGGAIMIFGVTTTVTGSITANGEASTDPNLPNGGSGGGGAGGSILIKAQTATLGSSLITATGGTAATGNFADGGDGGDGRIHLDYATSTTGTTNPTLDATQDDSLSASDGTALRLSVSDDGDATETQSWVITEEISTGTWNRWAVTWDASASTYKFYKDGSLLGTKTGTMTAIHDNAGIFHIGAEENSGGSKANFFDGLMDDVRVWNDVRTVTELSNHNQKVLLGTEPNQVAYYKLDGDYTDSQTDGNNDLTASGSPVFSTDVPFSGVTTRGDQDQSGGSTGNTYTFTTAIDEGTTHRQTFVPAKDPQKSIVVDFNAVSTGNVTITVHDALNREVSAVTIAAAQLVAGDFEFPFATAWRPVIGASYHFHATSTVADGTLKTTTLNDLEDAEFSTHFQFLVTDIDFHPAMQFLNKMYWGNGRYLAQWEGLTSSTYDPHRLTFPSGFRIRALAQWREFLVIGAWKGTSITDFDEGKMFFWDGTSEFHNFEVDVPEGGVNAMKGTKGLLHIIAGYQGDILTYAGGDAAQKIQRLPLLEEDKTIEIFPGAITMWKSILQIGVAGSSTSTKVERGVYGYGRLNRNYPNSLGADYPLSLGSQTSTNITTGMVKAVGQELLIGWKNNNTFGVDKVAIDNDPFAIAKYESLITDFGALPREKVPLVLRADFEKLASGESIVVKYKANREANWQESTAEADSDATDLRMDIPREVKELQVGVDLKSSGSTSPTLTALTFETELSQKTRST